MGKDLKIPKLPLRELGLARVSVPPGLLKEAQVHYDDGRYVEAFQLTEGVGPLTSWRGAEAQTFAYRLANNIGASRLAQLMICRARREYPNHVSTAVHFGYYLQGARGLIPCWQHCLASEKFAADFPVELSYLKGMRSTIAGTYRDFGTAWRLLEEALALQAPNPWLEVERATILLSAEKRVEALSALDAALELKSWYRPAVQMRARVLHMLGRVDDAISHLTESLEYLQSSPIVMQLMTLKREVDDHQGMEALADRFDELTVQAGETEKLWVRARRVDLLALRGDFSRAADYAEEIPGDYYEGLAERMRMPGVVNVRKRLPTEFVLQKHNTCAPATLAALAAFWSKPIKMEQIVDAICYDGTYDYSERSWAHENGFVAREFTVTLDSARQLIDSGLPFVLHSAEVSSGHSQAVVGYDLLRETLFIQDPGEPHYREVEAVDFFKTYRLNGPRGLVLVPVEQAEKIGTLYLPDADIYDVYHRFNKALSLYQRDSAKSALTEMSSSSPAHRLTLLAELSLANYDGNEIERLEVIERLLALFPEDTRLLNWQYNALVSLGTRQQRLELLSEAAAQNKSHSAFHVNLGLELMQDARDWPDARSRVRRAHRLYPGDVNVLSALGAVMRKVENAPADDWLVLYRFAAAMADKVESHAETWFSLARSQGRTEEAIEWLRRRERDYGAKSAAPAMTLALALDSMCLPESHEVLRAALPLHPESGDLLLQLARFEIRLGNAEEAQQLLTRARGLCLPAQWLRMQAMLKRRFGDHQAEMVICREILEKEPLALDTHAIYTRDLAAVDGAQAALQHISTTAERFPHHYGLGQLHVQWLREVSPIQALEKLHLLISQNPQDTWAYRELALILHDQSRDAEALKHAEKSVAISPDTSFNYSVLAHIQAALGKTQEAQESYRKAIRLDVNQAASFGGLSDLQNSMESRREVLGFIQQEMVRQVLTGSTLHTYRNLAFGILSREELLAELETIHTARPDLWEAWSVLIDQLIDIGKLDEALRLAQQAVEKFALLPGAWHDMAEVWQQNGKPEAALQCARHIVTLNPDWEKGWCLLAKYQEEAGQHECAAETLRKCCERLPLELDARYQLVTLLYRMNQRDEAWQIAANTVQSDPGASWAWNCLQNWAAPMQRGEHLINLAEKLTCDRPQEARSWDVLARLLPQERIQDLLAANSRALELNPRLVDAYDFRMEMLARAGRIEEAEKVLETSPWIGQEMPYSLQGRHAWLQAVKGNMPEAQRRMRQILEVHRDYYWGWEIYAGWAERRKYDAEWLRAANEMIRLAPRQPGPYCVAADAVLHAGQREKGISYLRKALQVDPGSPYAAQLLLSIYWGKRDIVALRESAASLPEIGNCGLIKRVYLMLSSAHQGELEKARSELDWLASQPDMLGSLLKTILDYFQNIKSKAAPLLGYSLKAAAAANTIGPSFAILWVEQETRQSRWQCWQKLAQWMPRLGEMLDPAISHYLDAIGAAGSASPHVEDFIRSSSVELQKRVEIWGKIGYALTSSSAWRATASWLMPNYKREDAEAWSLWNLSYCQRMLYESDKALEVSMHVIKKGLRDETWPRHVCFAACALALKGDYSTAENLLSLDAAPLEEDLESRLQQLIAVSLCRIHNRSSSSAKILFKDFLAESKRLLKGRFINRHVRQDYELAVEVMQKQTGAFIWPWERASRNSADHSSTNNSAGGNTMLYFVVAIFVINMLRQCHIASP